MQVTETIPPDVLFGRDYPYYSSFSPALLGTAVSMSPGSCRSGRLIRGVWWSRSRSNDGYLLQNFVAAGIPVLGIDPAEGPVVSARKRGIPTCRRSLERSLRASSPPRVSVPMS